MRTIKNLSVPKETDLSKFPYSTVINETETIDGTPVVREIYGDIITNLYALLVDRGIVPNEIEDNELNGYQILEAIKLNVNKLNDVRRTLEFVDGIKFSIDIDFSLLSSDYPIFVRSSENISKQVGTRRNSFMIQDNKGVDKIAVFKDNIITGDELLLIISDEITCVNLMPAELLIPTEINIQGVPLSYSSSIESDFLEDNTLIYNDGSSVDLKNIINDVDLVIRDVVKIKSEYLIFGINDATLKLSLHSYKRGDLDAANIVIPKSELSDDDISYRVQMYVHNNKIMFSHRCGAVVNPYRLYLYDYNNESLTYNSEITLASDFLATSNYLMTEDSIFITSEDAKDIKKYTFTGETENVYKLKQKLVNLYTKNINDKYIQVDESSVLWK